MRAFLALPLSDDAFLAMHEALLTVPGLRTVPPHQLHLTVAFFSDISSEQAKGMVEALSAKRFSAVTLSGLSLTMFPKARPQTLAIRFREDTDAIRLHDEVLGAIRDIASPKAGRFLAHCTLARFRAAPGGRIISAIRKVALPQTMALSRMVLFQSTLTKDGAIHVPMKEWTLSGDKNNLK